MIRTIQKKNKKYLTSSYFDDIKFLKKSKYDTDYGDLKRNSTFKVDELKRAYAIQEIILWRKGCIELSDYVSKLPNDQLKDTETLYLGQDWNELEENIDLGSQTKEISDPDND